MRLHRNAKTSPKMRQLIVERVREHGWTQPQAAAAAGISVRTVAKWIEVTTSALPAGGTSTESSAATVPTSSCRLEATKLDGVAWVVSSHASLCRPARPLARFGPRAPKIREDTRTGTLRR